jgi:outer membrane protein, multidrug efflux system
VWSVFNGGQLKNIAAAKTAEAQAASAEFARIGARSFADVEDAIGGEAALREQAGYAAAAVDAQQRSLNATQVEFRVGRTDARPMVQQQVRVYSAQMRVLHLRAETLSQRVALHLALGGDFGDEHAEDSKAGAPATADGASTASAR